jgi:energy-coupling factor transporter ATP-binding protein EcfA2
LCEDFRLTVILVEHECEFIAEYADSVLLMDDGALAHQAPPASFYSRLAHTRNEHVRIPQVTELAVSLVGCMPDTDAPENFPVRLEEARAWLNSSLRPAPGQNNHEPEKVSTFPPGKISSVLINADGLSFAYPDGTEALSNVSLQVRNGEYVALVGQNGSGKTTLARHLNGLLRPRSGRVLIAGEDIARRSVAQLSKDVGYLFQNPDHQLFADSVEAELLFGPLNHGVSREECLVRVERALQLCGITHLRNEHPLFTSRGERQLIAIASIVTMEPRLFIFDEPTTGLDERYYRLVVALLNDLHRRGHTIIVISHDMRLVAEHTERAVVLRQGKIVLDAPTPLAFERVDVLRETQIAPPQITELSRQLVGYGVRPALSVADLAGQLSPRMNQSKSAGISDHATDPGSQHLETRR